MLIKSNFYYLGKSQVTGTVHNTDPFMDSYGQFVMPKVKQKRQKLKKFQDPI